MDSPSGDLAYLMHNILKKKQKEDREDFSIFTAVPYSANSDNKISWTAYEVRCSIIWVRMTEATPIKKSKVPY